MSTTQPQLVHLFDISPSIAGKLHVAGYYLFRPGHPEPLRFPTLEAAVQHAVAQGWDLAPIPDDELHSADYPHNWFQLADHRWKKALELEARLKRKRKSS